MFVPPHPALAGDFDIAFLFLVKSDNTRGALLMATSMLAFVLNDGLMKYLFSDMNLYQALFLRGALTVPLIMAIAFYRNQLYAKIDARNWKILAVRIFAEVGATIFFLNALRAMPLANLTAILQALPLAVTMAAALFLGAAVGWRRWTATCVGFIGVLIIVRPGMEGFSTASLYALAAVGFVTLRDISTRQLSPEVPSLLVALLTAICVMLLGLVMVPTIVWVTPTPFHWLVLSGTAASIIWGYLFSVMAMRVGDISFVAPFRYTAMVFAITLGFLMFGEWPDGLTLLGTGIVVATGIYSFHRESMRNRRA